MVFALDSNGETLMIYLDMIVLFLRWRVVKCHGTWVTSQNPNVHWNRARKIAEDGLPALGEACLAPLLSQRKMNSPKIGAPLSSGTKKLAYYPYSVDKV